MSDATKPQLVALDPDIAAHEAVLATKEKRALKLVKRRRSSVRKRRPNLTHETILAWADAHHSKTGSWPVRTGGPILNAPGEKWSSVAGAMSHGSRGLPRGTTLAWLLHNERGVTHREGLKFSLDQVLAWADSYFARTGKWPTQSSGPVDELPGTTWKILHSSLQSGHHGLPRYTGLTSMLAEKRAAYNRMGRPLLTVETILLWADGYFKVHGRWPSIGSGPIDGEPYETWSKINRALSSGCRGLPKGDSLARLLHRMRAAPHDKMKEKLTEHQILVHADAWNAANGRWPNEDDGPVNEGAELEWSAINSALSIGLRGLPGGSSLCKLLIRCRGMYSTRVRPPLTYEAILGWADAWFATHGSWPSQASGDVSGVPHESWRNINQALRQGLRGLAGGNSLPRLLQDQRGAIDRLALPDLTIEVILTYCDEHRDRTGVWPKATSGTVHGHAPDTWHSVDMALKKGRRGLAGGTSLFQLLQVRFERTARCTP